MTVKEILWILGKPTTRSSRILRFARSDRVEMTAEQVERFHAQDSPYFDRIRSIEVELADGKAVAILAYQATLY